MTDATRRIPADAGFCTPSKLPRGPRGFALCRQCGTECPGARRTFCSSDCVDTWRSRTDPGYQARKVLERDRGVCESCSRDCLALLAELKEFRRQCRRERWGAARESIVQHAGTFPFEWESGPFADRCRELGLPQHLSFLARRLWEMDHRIPVAEGGGSCGLENLRTLCWACHRQATAGLAKRRAARRRVGPP